MEFVLDDYLDNFYPQASSQWDALCHVMHPSWVRTTACPRARSPGAAESASASITWRAEVSRDAACSRISRATTKAWERPRPHQGGIDSARGPRGNTRATEEPAANGDVLLIRTGWTQFYYGLSDSAKEELARETVVAGIEGSDRVAKWLWNHHLSAVASDSPALEALPKAAGNTRVPALSYAGVLRDADRRDVEPRGTGGRLRG